MKRKTILTDCITSRPHIRRVYIAPAYYVYVCRRERSITTQALAGVWNETNGEKKLNERNTTTHAICVYTTPHTHTHTGGREWKEGGGKRRRRKR